MEEKWQPYFDEFNQKIKQKYPSFNYNRDRFNLFDDITEFWESLPDEYWRDSAKEWSNTFVSMEMIEERKNGRQTRDL